MTNDQFPINTNEGVACGDIILYKTCLGIH
jgi:hypothetical protein